MTSSFRKLSMGDTAAQMKNVRRSFGARFSSRSLLQGISSVIFLSGVRRQIMNYFFRDEKSCIGACHSRSTQSLIYQTWLSSRLWCDHVVSSAPYSSAQPLCSAINTYPKPLSCSTSKIRPWHTSPFRREAVGAAADFPLAAGSKRSPESSSCFSPSRFMRGPTKSVAGWGRSAADPFEADLQNRQRLLVTEHQQLHFLDLAPWPSALTRLQVPFQAFKEPKARCSHLR